MVSSDQSRPSSTSLDTRGRRPSSRQEAREGVVTTPQSDPRRSPRREGVGGCSVPGMEPTAGPYAPNPPAASLPSRTASTASSIRARCRLPRLTVADGHLAAGADTGADPADTTLSVSPMKQTRTPPERSFRLSGRRDSNSGPLVPQTRHLPLNEEAWRGCAPVCAPGFRHGRSTVTLAASPWRYASSVAASAASWPAIRCE